MAPQNEAAFVPALIVVDMQEDFCPPVSLNTPGEAPHLCLCQLTAGAASRMDRWPFKTGGISRL